MQQDKHVKTYNDRYSKNGKKKVQGATLTNRSPSQTKQTNIAEHKSNKRTKSTKISSLFPKQGNRNVKRTENYKKKITQDKIENKLPRRINHKATKCKTNAGTTALERSVE